MLYLPVLSRVAYGNHSPRKWYRGDSILVKGIASPVSPLIAVISRSDLDQLLAHLARSRMASAMLYAHEACFLASLPALHYTLQPNPRAILPCLPVQRSGAAKTVPLRVACQMPVSRSDLAKAYVVLYCIVALAYLVLIK